MPTEFINNLNQLLKFTFEPIETAGISPKKTHEGHTYVKIGEIKTNSSTWVRVAYAIKGIAAMAFACLLIPLLFPSFRFYLSHSWSQFWNSSKNTNIYLKDTSRSSQVSGLNGVSQATSLYSPFLGTNILAQEAKKLVKQGRYFEAGLFYQKCLEIDPKNAPLRVEYAEVLKKQGEEHTKELRKLYEEGIKLAPNSKTLLFNHAKFDVEDKEAERDYKKALEKNPDNVDLRIAYAKLLIKRYKNSKSTLLDDGERIRDEVLDIYKTGLQRQPHHPLLLLKYAKFLIMHLNQTQEAVDRYQNAQVDSSNIDFHTSYANILPRYLQEMAQEIYQRCLDQQPNNVHLLLRYAEFLQNQFWHANNDKIIFYGERALAISPDSVEVYFRYGNLLSIIDPAKAQVIYQTGLDLQPDNLKLLGKSFHDETENALNESIHRYQKGLAINPKNTELRIAAYSHLACRTSQQKILHFLEEGLDLQPCDQILLEEYKFACDQLQQPEKAIERYQRAFEIDSDNHYFLTEIIQNLDENQQVKLIEKAIERQPDNPQNLIIYGYLLYAKIQQADVIDEKLINLCLSQFRKAAKLAPTNGCLRTKYAQALFYFEKTSEAIEQYKRMINLGIPLSRESRAKYIEALEKLKLEKEIEIYYQTFLQNHPNFFLHEEYIEWLTCQDRMQDALNELEKTLNYQIQYDKYMDLLHHILIDNGRISREEIDETCENYLLVKIAEQPQNAILKWFLARFLEEKNQFNTAIEQCKEILKLHPHLSKIQAKYVDLLEKNENWDDLEAYAESLDQNHSQDTSTIFRIISILKYENEIERVIRLYEKVRPILSNAQLEDYEDCLLRGDNRIVAVEALHEFKCKKYPSVENFQSYGTFLYTSDKSDEEKANIYFRLLSASDECMQSGIKNLYIEILQKLNKQKDLQNFLERLCKKYPTIDSLEYYMDYLRDWANPDEHKLTQIQNILIELYKIELDNSNMRANYLEHSGLRSRYFNLLSITGQEDKICNYFKKEDEYYQHAYLTQPQLIKSYGLMLNDWSKYLKEEEQFFLIQKSADLLAQALEKADAQFYLDLKNIFPNQLLKLNKLNEIEAFYQKGLVLNPDSIPMRLDYAKYLKNRHNFEKSLDEFLLIIEKEKASWTWYATNISTYYLEAAHILDQLNRLGEAASYYKKYEKLSRHQTDEKYQEFKRKQSNLLDCAVDLP
ncbi:tetratricopeptide repeat protein [Candidatus Protochlamydia amoebophila]|uniref:Putative O-linked N-acetylglucosamine transferase n=1 Tax=Candidatus Protochlamydia amoebophila TaxID=362787 RepID=A0A0C1JSU1_9BACT|nr:tetratricopeptide repeat protein [Candidatus Protochlamydia amoebophila]KIC74180.1 putative O-linked N-acetylglucosamine transferase [Candidatus Protochlamydia amoebophila]